MKLHKDIVTHARRAKFATYQYDGASFADRMRLLADFAETVLGDAPLQYTSDTKVSVSKELFDELTQGRDAFEIEGESLLDRYVAVEWQGSEINLTCYAPNPARKVESRERVVSMPELRTEAAG